MKRGATRCQFILYFAQHKKMNFNLSGPFMVLKEGNIYKLAIYAKLMGNGKGGGGGGSSFEGGGLGNGKGMEILKGRGFGK